MVPLTQFAELEQSPRPTKCGTTAHSARSTELAQMGGRFVFREDSPHDDLSGGSQHGRQPCETLSMSTTKTF